MKLDQTVEKCGEMLGALMRDNKEEMYEAIENLEEQAKEQGKKGKPKLSVSANFVFSPQKDGSNKVTATLSFSVRKTKAQLSARVDEDQGNMFDAVKEGESEVSGEQPSQ